MMEFTYNGIVRHGFGFYNPNHAAALVTMIIPVLWGLRRYFKSITAKSFIVCIEIIFYIALVLTYSRTGTGTLILSVIFFYTFTHFCLKTEPVKIFKSKAVKREILIIGGIGLFILTAAFMTGSTGRYFKWIISPDKSVTNRFSLWNGAFQMLADNPDGVGTGLSGRMFTDFMQAPDASGEYRTMVNSFLTFICEQGIIPFFIITILMAFIVFSSFRIISSPAATFKVKLIAITLSAILFSAFVNGCFSTCFDLSTLPDLKNGGETNNIMQTVLFSFAVSAVLSLLFLSIKHRECFNLKKIGGMALLTSIIICFSIFLYGSFFSENDIPKVQVFTVDGTNFVKIIPADVEAKTFLILPDVENSGHKKLRQFIKEKYGNVRMIFPLSSSSSNIPSDLLSKIDYLVICGKNVSIDYALKKQNSGSLKLIYYLPCYEPILFDSHIHKIYLNEFDEYGVNAAWKRKVPSEKIEYCY